MNLPTKTNDSMTQKVPVSFTPTIFFCFCFFLWKVEVRQIQSQGEDASHLSLNYTVEGSASELVTLARHYSQQWETGILGQGDSWDLFWRCILECEEPCPERACISLWTMPGPASHQRNPMLSTFWNTVQILYLKNHGQNFHYLSLTRSNYTQKKFTQTNHLADSVKSRYSSAFGFEAVEKAPVL